jgi:hypothetical protein
MIRTSIAKSKTKMQNMGAFAHFNRKTKFKMLKTLEKNICMYIFMFYMLTHSFIK